MQWGLMTGVGGIAALSAVIATGGEARHYPVPLAVARERLVQAPLPEPLLSLSGGRMEVERTADGLRWRFGRADPGGEAIVRLTASGASTKVMVRFHLPPGAAYESPITGTALTAAMAESMFAEHVDATLSGRAFDQQQMALAVAQAIRDNPELLREQAVGIRQHMLDVSSRFKADSHSQTASDWMKRPEPGDVIQGHPDNNQQ